MVEAGVAVVPAVAVGIESRLDISTSAMTAVMHFSSGDSSAKVGQQELTTGEVMSF